MIYTEMIKWYTDTVLSTDTVWAVAAKKAIETMDMYSLERILSTGIGLLPTEADYMATSLIRQELQRRKKEEKKMEDKRYYSGSVAVTTWRSRRPSKGDYVALNRKTDLITFRKGRYMGAALVPENSIPTRLPIDKLKMYTKEEITEAITTAWDKGEYADDQTDISWIFNSDGFTGTVDLATVLLKDKGGLDGCLDVYYHPQIRARCRVRIVDGTFFEKLDGSSKLADILKNHKGVFATKKDIVTYLKNKWYVGDFGNDASYFNLDIEEED